MNEKSEILVEWRPDLGPDWGPEDEAEVERLVAQLRRARPVVRRLRQALSLSQAEAARILGTTQSNVSKIEAKTDPTLSVLRRLVESRGGKLEVRAVLPDGREIVLLPWEPG
ncbi:MAG TPA: helix-turn-helix domain-containing protein [Allosphingosinicella sp.]|nr:helix-turn-helix domain-containing protein [Allosphingosinicella sp.]